MLFEDWEFISNIPLNVKPCFYDKTYTYLNEWFVTLKRRYKGEKAEKGIIYLNNLIDKTNDYYKDSFDINSLKALKEILQKCINGISNLVETYKKDGQEEVSKDYDKCLDRVKSMIKDIEKKTNKKGFFSSTPIIFVKK